MNERIRELQKQAFDFVAKQNRCKEEYFWENIRHNRELQDSVDKKFAELIVQECMLIANTYQTRGGNCYVDDMIAKHFGVEE